MFSSIPTTFLGHATGGGGGATSYISSVQPFEITIGGGDTTDTVTISSVTTSRSVIFWGGVNTDNISSTQREINARVELTNATTVTASRDTSDASYSVTVWGTVVEFTSDMVDSVQTGTINISSGTSATATVSSVDTSRSAVFYLGFTSDGATSSADNVTPALTLTNATTVTATRGETTSLFTPTVGYALVQFKAGVIDSVQQRTVAFSGTNNSETDTISSVNTSRTMLIWQGVYSTISTISAWKYDMTLTNNTTVTFTRENTSSTDRSIHYTAIEFASGVVGALRRGSTTLGTSTTTLDTSISSVNTSKAVLNFGGYRTDSTNVDSSFTSAKLQSATSVRAQRSDGVSGSTAVGWEVVEFN